MFLRAVLTAFAGFGYSVPSSITSHLKLSVASEYGERCSRISVWVGFLSKGKHFAGKFENGKGYLCTENFMLLVGNAAANKVGTFCWSIISVLRCSFQVLKSIASITLSGMKDMGVKSPRRKSGGREGERA